MFSACQSGQSTRNTPFRAWSPPSLNYCMLEVFDTTVRASSAVAASLWEMNLGMRDTYASAICTSEHVAPVSADRSMLPDDPVIRLPDCTVCHTSGDPAAVSQPAAMSTTGYPVQTPNRIISCDPVISTWSMSSVTCSRGRLVPPQQLTQVLIDAHPATPGPGREQMSADCVYEHIRVSMASKSNSIIMIYELPTFNYLSPNPLFS